METTSEIVVTDRMLWSGALLLLAIALPLLGVAVRLVPRARFDAARSALPWAAFVVWAVIWLAVVTRYWEAVYRHFFPSWSRWGLPIAFGLFFAAWGWLLGKIARRAVAQSALVFVLLGALLGPVTHLLAVGRGLLEKSPMLRGASPLAAVVVSAPEFAIYWSLILLLAVAAHGVREWRTRAGGSNAERRRLS